MCWMPGGPLTMTSPTVAVVVPSYNRPEVLRLCLEGLALQTRPPDEVILVVRGCEGGYEELVTAWREAKTYSGLVQMIRVTREGQTVAMNAGVAATQADFVFFTDDDAVPRPAWIERQMRHYLNPLVAGVGGRDVLPWSRDAGPSPRCASITWYGKIIGDHHLGTSDLREVDHLKGVNMSLRRSLLPQFDEHLLGDVVYNEVDVCMQLRARGYRLLFDPAAPVDHFPATRHVGAARGEVTPERVYHDSFNNTYVLGKNLTGVRRVAFLAFTFAIGSGNQPGVLGYAINRFLRGRKDLVLRQSIQGKIDALALLRRIRRPTTSQSVLQQQDLGR